MHADKMRKLREAFLNGATEAAKEYVNSVLVANQDTMLVEGFILVSEDMIKQFATKNKLYSGSYPTDEQLTQVRYSITNAFRQLTYVVDEYTYIVGDQRDRYQAIGLRISL